MAAVIAPYLFGSESHCSHANVSYEQRVDDPDHFNWCPVPDGGYDAVLFVGVALLVACFASAKLSAIWVLMAGAVYEGFAFYFNLGHLTNAATLWMGMEPAELFLYVFLPPLLLDSAVRIDYFLFRKVMWHVLVFAFLMVAATLFSMIPYMLYVLGLAKEGWRSVDVALFISMLASTDAVAVTAILRSGGAPELLSVLLEGESLFNDATSIVFFEVFRKQAVAGASSASGVQQAVLMIQDIAYLAGVGAVMGIVGGMLTRFVVRVMQWRMMKPHVEVTVTVAMAYLVFFVTNVYVGASGVIAVVVLGLYGSAVYTFGLSAKASRQDAFFRFWNVLSFMANGLVFFFVGASCVNFTWRASRTLFDDIGLLGLLGVTAWKLPMIYIAVFALRFVAIVVLNPVLRAVGAGDLLTLKSSVFATVGGLRGGLSLILAQTIVVLQEAEPSEQKQEIKAEMAIWTAGFVILTLLVNAPLLTPLLGYLGLNEVSPVQQLMRRKTKQALLRYTATELKELQSSEEMLHGVDWTVVSKTVDFSAQLQEKLPEESKPLETKIGVKLSGGTNKRGLDNSAHCVRQRLLSVSERPEAAVGEEEEEGSDVERGGASEGTIRRRLAQQEEVLAAALRAVPVEGTPFVRTASLRPGRGAAGAIGGPNLRQVVSALSLPSLPRAAQTPGAPAAAAGAKEEGEAASGSDGGAATAKRELKKGSSFALHIGGELESSDDSDKGADSRGGGPPPRPAAVPVPAPVPVPVPTAAPAEEAQGVLPVFTVSPFDPKDARGPDDATWQLRGSSGNNTELRVRRLPSFKSAAASRGGGSSGAADRHSGATLARSSFLFKPFASRNARGAGAVVVVEEAQDTEEEAAEYRLRVLAGFKRHFHTKYKEGLIEVKSLRILDYCVEGAMEDPYKPLELWEKARAELSARGGVLPLAATHFSLQRAVLALQGALTPWLAAFVVYPLRWLSARVGRKLGHKMLVAVEVALELWLAMEASPQSRWLQYSGSVGGMVSSEVASNAIEVWEFLRERELEAPDRFAAIQTQRASLVLLAKQLMFVEKLADQGLIEEAEQESLSEMIEHRTQRLERRGPSWTQPTLSATLRTVPFLAELDDTTFAWVRAHSELRVFTAGQTVLPMRGGEMGIIVVVSGALVGDLRRGDEMLRTHITAGEVAGLLSVLVPGADKELGLQGVVAEDSGLGKGTVVFLIPNATVEAVRQRAAHGDPPFVSLELDLFRTLALMTLDYLKDHVVNRLVQHVFDTLKFIKLESGNDQRGLKRQQRRMNALLTTGVNVLSEEDRMDAVIAATEVEDDPEDVTLSSSGTHTVISVDELLLKQVTDKVEAVYRVMVSELASADLVVVAPYGAWTQRSTAVLLEGSMTPSITADNVIGDTHELVHSNRPVHVPPTVLVWTPEHFEPEKTRFAFRGGMTYHAGPSGATLVVCGGEYGSSSDEGEAMATSSAAAAGPISAAALQRTVSSHQMPRPVAVRPSRMLGRQHTGPRR